MSDSGSLQENSDNMVRWESLDSAEQTRLRVEYGCYLDQMPPTCSLEKKNSRFMRWLAERNILYTP